MKVLIDTNVLMPTAHVRSPDQAPAIAALERHGLTHRLTFNVEHFQRFVGVERINPKLAGAPAP